MELASLIIGVFSLVISIIGLSAAIFVYFKEILNSEYRKGSKIKTKWNNTEHPEDMYGSSISSCKSKLLNQEILFSSRSADDIEKAFKVTTILLKHNACFLAFENFSLTKAKNADRVKEISNKTKELLSNFKSENYDEINKRIEKIHELVDTLPGKEAKWK